MNKQKIAFDPIAKKFYTSVFENYGVLVDAGKEVFSKSLSIDLAVKCDNKQQLAHTAFKHFLEYNAIELKGAGDRLTMTDFNRIMMRVWGMGAVEINKDKKSSEKEKTFWHTKSLSDPYKRTLTIISVIRPRNILKKFFFETTNRAGVYYRKGFIKTWIIHPDELDLIPENYPLLALSRGKKLKQFIQHCATNKAKYEHYLDLILSIGILNNADATWKIIQELNAMPQVISKSTFPLINQFLEQRPELRNNLPIFQEIRDEERNKGKDEGKLIFFKTMLTRRFGHISKQIEATLQSASDKQLEQWSDKFFTAKTMDDIF